MIMKQLGGPDAFIPMLPSFCSHCLLALLLRPLPTHRWVKQLGGPDAWNAACLYKNNPANCPDISRWA